VIIGQFDVAGVAIFPAEADAELVVHPDTVLPRPAGMSVFPLKFGRLSESIIIPRMVEPEVAKAGAASQMAVSEQRVWMSIEMKYFMS
jgi:hypothetical protein